MTSLELKMNLEQQQLTTLSLSDLSIFYNKQSKHFRSINGVPKIISYIESTKDLLYTGMIDAQVADKMLVCLGILCYADPIFSMGIRDSKVFEDFSKAANRSPYCLPKNLCLEFVPVELNHYDDFFDTHLVGVAGLPNGLFEQRQVFVNELLKRRNGVSSYFSGRNLYSKFKHHELVGLHEVCIPLFSGYEKEEVGSVHSSVIAGLSRDWGSFRQPFPSCLVKFVQPYLKSG